MPLLYAKPQFDQLFRDIRYVDEPIETRPFNRRIRGYLELINGAVVRIAEMHEPLVAVEDDETAGKSAAPSTPKATATQGEPEGSEPSESDKKLAHTLLDITIESLARSIDDMKAKALSVGVTLTAEIGSREQIEEAAIAFANFIANHLAPERVQHAREVAELKGEIEWLKLELDAETKLTAAKTAKLKTLRASHDVQRELNGTLATERDELKEEVERLLAAGKEYVSASNEEKTHPTEWSADRTDLAWRGLCKAITNYENAKAEAAR